MCALTRVLPQAPTPAIEWGHGRETGPCSCGPDPPSGTQRVGLAPSSHAVARSTPRSSNGRPTT